MASWIFNPSDFEEKSYEIIPEGDVRARIEDVVEKTFRSGNSGMEITLSVSGFRSKVWYYLVFDHSDTKKTNQKIGSFFESFGIVDPDLSHYRNWIGKMGGVRIRHEDFNNSVSAKVAFCLSKKNQEKLPAWKETGSAAPSPAAPVIEHEELPFM